ncbi:hypothetical protein GEV27_15945 [Aeromicrobium sp. S22]|uniref:hypothetical protein n=1 Tax=Aeromicrobium sp. S22 TaxID=2662029 RepID=UPI00129E6CAD|nr:hypothetical protein [Aeromicrobium sp. S22]MRK03011.1 hypothetical protein [Aeromicrobium sp. S22]
MTSPRPETITCLAALRLAAARWENATGLAQTYAEDEDTIRFATVGEALFWASALDEQLPRASQTEDEQLLAGMQYARNRMTHGLVVTTTEHAGAVWPMTFPTHWNHYRWRSADDIPPPTTGQGKSDAGQRLTAYRAVWEGQLVSQTLNALTAHFENRLT